MSEQEVLLSIRNLSELKSLAKISTYTVYMYLYQYLTHDKL